MSRAGNLPPTSGSLTPGARMLTEALERGPSQVRVAELLGVSQPLISDWRRGMKRPNGDQRFLLRVLFGIPVDAWRMLDEQQRIAEAVRRIQAFMDEGE